MDTHSETTTAYLAGVLTARGGFDEHDGRTWIYIATLDRSIADAAMDLWGGSINEKCAQNGTRQYKWSALGGAAERALGAMQPHLMGQKHDRARKLLLSWAEPGTQRLTIGVD